MSEGRSLEIGSAFRGSVVRQDRTLRAASTWLASVNSTYLSEHPDRASAMARVEADIESPYVWKWCSTIGSCIERRRGNGQRGDYQALCNLLLTLTFAFGTFETAHPRISSEPFVHFVAERARGPAEEYKGGAEGRQFNVSACGDWPPCLRATDH